MSEPLSFAERSYVSLEGILFTSQRSTKALSVAPVAAEKPVLAKFQAVSDLSVSAHPTKRDAELQPVPIRTGRVSEEIARINRSSSCSSSSSVSSSPETARAEPGGKVEIRMALPPPLPQAAAAAPTKPLPPPRTVVPVPAAAAAAAPQPATTATAATTLPAVTPATSGKKPRPNLLPPGFKLQAPTGSALARRRLFGEAAVAFV